MDVNDPQANAPQQRRLTRSNTDRVIGGVCGGLGRYFNVDPIFFRIGAVGLAFVGGAGLLLYLAALLLVPAEGDTAPAALGVGVIIICGVLALGGAIAAAAGPDWLVPALVVVAGAAIAAGAFLKPV